MANLNQLRWRCRRGTLELDIWFENYLDKGFPGANEQEKAAFIELLSLEDNVLLPFLNNERAPETESLAALVKKMRELMKVRSNQMSAIVG